MGIQSSWRSLVKNLLGVNSAENQIDIVDELDKSWSGRARDGPLHYHPASREGSVRFGYSSRDPSVRGSAANVVHSHTHDVSNRGRYPGHSTIQRTSSEPRNISSMIHLPTPPNQDSASSVHESIITAPMDIHPDNRPRLPTTAPDRRSRRQRSHTTTATANLQRHSSTAPSHSTYLNNDDAVRHADQRLLEDQHTASITSRGSSGHPLSPTRHGGLSTAFSRETSHRNSHTTTTMTSPSTASNDSMYGDTAHHTKKTPSTIHLKRRDSATQHGDTRGHDGGVTMIMEEQHQYDHHPGVQPQQQKDEQSIHGDDMHEGEYSAALRSLQSTFPDPGTTPNGGAGVIVIDTSLAITDWDVQQRDGDQHDTINYTSSGSNNDQEEIAGVDGVDININDNNAMKHPKSTTTTTDASVETATPSTTTTSSSKDWNAKFIKRWKSVRHRARLQALGVRSLWKLSSPPNEHHPPELLVHDMSTTTLGNTTTTNNDGGMQMRVHQSSAVGMKGSRSRHDMNRDPSLATMLLAEAEVC